VLFGVGLGGGWLFEIGREDVRSVCGALSLGCRCWWFGGGVPLFAMISLGFFLVV
jgi:hypothetical protein